ncbi:MAG: o-succinylbenzoate synthase [Microcoleaceae cyanobacterium]
MNYQFEFHPYRCPFKHPLNTHHGIWRERQGILLQLTNEAGNTGWGEIAPLSWFGSETLEQALTICQNFPKKFNLESIEVIPDTFPACQFGFESAVMACNSSQDQPQLKQPLNYSGLLPAGELALQKWQDLYHQGYRTFKWKIGVYLLELELEIFQTLTQAMIENSSVCSLRLDANGGLTWKQANQWLQTCDTLQNISPHFQIEFLEQPLKVSQFEELLALSSRYATPLALDESVATLNQLKTCYQQRWRGIFVIKPAISGSPKQLKQFCQDHNIDAVFSSVFETHVGRNAILNLATELSSPRRAVGFGVDHWLEPLSIHDALALNFS